jgi:hypothetical protein
MADQCIDIKALIRQAADLACQELATRPTSDQSGEDPAGDDARNTAVQQRLVELLGAPDSAAHWVRVSAPGGRTRSDHEGIQPRVQEQG